MPLPDPSKLNFQLDVLGTLSPSGGVSQETVNVLHYRRLAVAVPHDPTAFLNGRMAGRRLRHLDDGQYPGPMHQRHR
jgi:hypothetical protein